jgi:hypothetical protein
MKTVQSWAKLPRSPIHLPAAAGIARYLILHKPIMYLRPPPIRNYGGFRSAFRGTGAYYLPISWSCIANDIGDIGGTQGNTKSPEATMEIAQTKTTEFSFLHTSPVVLSQQLNPFIHYSYSAS